MASMPAQPTTLSEAKALGSLGIIKINTENKTAQAAEMVTLPGNESRTGLSKMSRNKTLVSPRVLGM